MEASFAYRESEITELWITTLLPGATWQWQPI